MQYIRLYIKNGIAQIAHSDTFYFLRYAHSSSANFQIILKNITFLKAANSDSVHEDLRN